MKTLANDNSIEIKYVYHISDIHIRNTQRHDEYTTVFNRLYERLQSIPSASLIVITGDVMHSKTELSPEAISLVYTLFDSLSRIAPVIVIPGNHDCNLSNKTRLDALTPIEVIGKLRQFYYLKTRGFYRYHNIVFGVTDIFHNKLIAADELNEQDWNDVQQVNKYKIALYHGAVHGSVTDVGYRMNNHELLVSDFAGYDYVLLGDIHRHQYMNDSKTIAYAGSLIQQSHGESLKGHGVLKWNLATGKSQLIDIPNDYGYCTVRIVNGDIEATVIPAKPRIRFILDGTNNTQYREAVKVLSTTHEILETVKESDFNKNLCNNPLYHKKLKTKISSFYIQDDIMKSYLKTRGVSRERIQDIMHLHTDTYRQITLETRSTSHKWTILELKFSNMLSYGKNNVIDFTKYEPNKIIGIVAPNHYGKSNLLDIILFCLFDKFSRGRRQDIINKNRDKMHCSLTFTIGNKKYMIEKTGTRINSKVKITINFYQLVIENGEEVKEDLNGVDQNDTNKKIKELLGSYDDYLTTCICLQQDKTYNFIDMTQLQKKEYLNNTLQLNVFDSCHTIVKDKLKELTGQLHLLEHKIETISLDALRDVIRQNDVLCKKLQAERDVLTAVLLDVDYLVTSSIPEPLKVYHELSRYDLHTEAAITATITRLTDELEKPVDARDVTSLKGKLIELQEESVVTKIDVDKLMQQRESLLATLVHIPPGYVFLDDVDDEEIERRIDVIDELLTSLAQQTEHVTRCEELKTVIATLKSELKVVNKNVVTELTELYQQVDVNLKLLFDASVKYFRQQPLPKPELKRLINVKTTFVNDIHTNLTLLDQYQSGYPINDTIITTLKTNAANSLVRHQSWIDMATEQLNDATIDPAALLQTLATLQDTINTKSFELFDLHYNDITESRIHRYQCELDKLAEYSGRKREIDNLVRERVLLQDKSRLVKEKMIQDAAYRQHLDTNAVTKLQLTELESLINTCNARLVEIDKTRKRVQRQITDAETIMTELQEKRLHLQLLNHYHLSYLHWSQMTCHNQEWLGKKAEVNERLALITRQITTCSGQLLVYQKELQQYLEYRKELDAIYAQIDVYELYCQVTDYNGLPYEILKVYLPLIESDVNRILSSICSFSIDVVYNDEIKKTTAGCIDININYSDMQPHNICLASGFERFIINLALRMTLYNVSLNAKPNFIIIDEGWSCMDPENLNNISTIMNYIQMQFEHVIIISHIAELKNQADYIINISKRANYSYL